MVVAVAEKLSIDLWILHTADKSERIAQEWQRKASIEKQADRKELLTDDQTRSD
jgi:hypothetical protein